MTEQERVLAGGGDMGARMRAKDWCQTALGPVEDWPPTLRTGIGLLLASSSPMGIYWGDALNVLYNDSYVRLIGAKHPAALGVPFDQVFPELWSESRPLFDRVMRTGSAVSLEKQLHCIDRQGFLEEAYFTYAYLPLRDEHGRIGGLLGNASEATSQVLGDRRFKCLRELSIRTSPVPTVQGVLHEVQGVLAGCGADVPFALLYRVEGEQARLVLRTGLEAGGRVAPETLALGDPNSPWPLGEVQRSGAERLVEGLETREGALHAGPWPEPVRRALLLPLTLGGGGQDAVLVVGLSPRLPLDAPYRDFLQLLARQVAADIARVRALEQETQRAEQLAELDRAKTNFFSNVSHEFRTPLTLLLGPLEDLLDGPLAPEQRERASLVQRNAQRLLKLVNTLLDFSRLEAGRARASFQPVDLAALTAGLASAFDSAMNKAGLRLEVDCPALREPVWVDPDAWEKIVLNLLSNAFKFTFAGSIRVRLRGRPGHVELSVSDTGTGIPAGELPHLFERFHQVKGARGRSQEGSGIGLALVRELARLHGGGVQVESTPGQGSTFTVTLPRGSAHLPAGQLDGAALPVTPSLGPTPFLQELAGWRDAAPPEPLEPEASAPRTKPGRAHLLLADDNADMREHVRRLLAGRYTLETVADGNAALEAIRARVPDLVLSDVMMPGLDGFGLVHSLRADPRTALLPIVLLSARAGEEARVEGLASGADDYLVKPFSGRELRARVESSLRLSRERNERGRLATERADFEQYLIGIVSHDLRNPLTAISLSATALRRGGSLGERPLKSVERILSAAERAQRMIHDLLDFTRARLGGGLPVERQSVDFHALARQVVEELRGASPGRELALEQYGEGQAMWDADRVAQVLANLISNALHYSPPGTPVRVRSLGDAEAGVLEVHNEGPPIAEDLLPRLFQPMQRGVEGHSSRRSVGLGLYIVEQLVRAHGGRIDVRSVQGEGTTFRVSLPRTGTAPGAAGERQS